ncbi:MAG: MOSC domain-containing protein [Bdellovibrio sp.]|jgi:uncharacterized protein YcbX
MKLAEIWIYPIKSCQGILVADHELLATGLKFDRQWMMVKPDGSMLTQREYPQMARIQLNLNQDLVGLKVSHDEFLELTGTNSKGATPFEVTVWGEKVLGSVEEDSRVHEFLSDFLQEPVLLVAAGGAFRRFVVEKNSGQKQAQDQPVYFADQQPLLITTTQSLSDLNSRLREPVPMSRFRPNLVIDNPEGEPFAEESWQSLELPDVSISIRQKCARCPIVTSDQLTGQKVSHEPLKTLAGLRREGSKAHFGMHAWATKTGRVSLGDGVRALGVGSL